MHLNRTKHVVSGPIRISATIAKRLPAGHPRMLVTIFRLAAIAVSVLFSMEATAGLVGTQLTLSVEEEVTPTSPTFVTSFPRTVTVSATAVEFPDVASLFDPNSPTLPGFAHSLVNLAIDVGDNFITVDFHNAGFGSFASGAKNGDLFEFGSQALANITGASIDAQTTLGLVPSDLVFAGNTLFINVEGLPFNPNTFARIDLTVEGGPTAVPEPSTWAMLLVGIAGIAGMAWRKRRRLA